MSNKRSRSLKDAILSSASSVASYIRDRSRLATGLAIVVVLIIMAAGTYVSIVIPRQRLAKIDAAYAVGDYATVIEVGTQAFDANPYNVRVALALAAAILRQGEMEGTQADAIERAREVLTIADRLSPGYSEVSRQIGFTYLLEKDMDNALIYVQRALDIDPQNAGAHATMCQYLDDVGRHSEALVSCERSLVLDPYNAQAYVISAKVALVNLDTRKARIYAASAIAYATDAVALAEAHSVAAYVAVQTYDLASGRKHVEAALAANPKDFDSLVLFGEIAMRTMAYEALRGEEPTRSADWQPMLKRAATAMRVNGNNYYPYFLYMRAYEITGDDARASYHREIARRLVEKDVSISGPERNEILERLDASTKVKITAIKQVPTSSIPTDAQRTVIIEP